MKIEIVSKNYAVKEKLKDIIEKKVERLERLLGEKASAKVVCAQNKDRFKMELNLYTDGRFIRSEVESDNMYANIDLCIAKVEKQIVKYSSKLKSLKKKSMSELSFFDEVLPEFKESKITRRKVYALSPMSEEEALEQMDMIGHDFFIFLSNETNTVCVLYRRADGDYGIIETM